jgi:hypothetical protein
MATCYHVVSPHATKVKSITVQFPNSPEPVAASVLRWNDRTDCALLELKKALPEIEALNLGGKCEWKASWNSYGYPSLAKHTGVTMSGLVSDPDATDDQNTEVLELTSEEAGAGMAAPLHGFSGSPVIVGDCVVGHLKRYLKDPSNPRSAAWGKVYATRSACVWGLLQEDGSEATPPPPIRAPLPGSASQAQHIETVRELLERSSQANKDGRPSAPTALAAVESLIQLGQPVEALEVLTTVPPSLRQSQLRALALGKIGVPETLDVAVKILEELKGAGNFDAETGGLLGGRYKQIWLRSRDITFLEKSHKIYNDTFEITQDFYPGINAAATALWLEQKPQSEQIAHRVIGVLDSMGVTIQSKDPWALATKAEALLICGKLDQAKTWYRRAALESNFAKETVQTMRSQATRNLDALGFDDHSLDDVFLPNSR